MCTVYTERQYQDDACRFQLCRAIGENSDARTVIASDGIRIVWNAAQSEFICFADDDIDPRSTRPIIGKPDMIYAGALPRFIPSQPSGQRNAAISEFKRSTICAAAARFGNKVILIK
jgi:hypothetical protein